MTKGKGFGSLAEGKEGWSCDKVVCISEEGNVVDIDGEEELVEDGLDMGSTITGVCNTEGCGPRMDG